MHICRTNDKFKQVRVDDSQYDANTLPAFAAERRRMQLSIEISCPQGAQQQTRRCCCRSIVKSDGRTPTLYGPCSTYYVSSVISKAVTRGLFWVFEHTREFQVKIRHTKRNYTSFTFYAFYKLGNAPNRFRPGLRSGPHWGSLQRSLRPIAGGEGARRVLFKNPTLSSALRASAIQTMLCRPPSAPINTPRK